MAGSLLTVSVTLTVCEGTPEAAIVMVPLYVFAVKPDVFTATLMAPGVVPEPAVTDSHEPPVAVAVNANPVEPAMSTDCAVGAVPPS